MSLKVIKQVRLPREIPIVDLFAGPGGLGEGFHQYNSDEIRFSTVLSIEKDPSAIKTLKLRTFFRFFEGSAPEEYYRYVRGEDISQEELYATYPKKANAAEQIVHEIDLASSKTVQTKTDRLIKQKIGSEKWWILIGGPPCQAYSLAGRSRMVGQHGREKFEEDHRHFLYREYLRIIEKFRPPLFVMENVKGLVTATHGNENMFDKIRSDLSAPVEALGYSSHSKIKGKSEKYQLFSLSIPADCPTHLSPHDYVIKSELFGVPQNRHRVILLGIRADLDTIPEQLLTKARTPVTVGEVINDMPALRSAVSLSRKKSFDEKTKRILSNEALSDGEKWRRVVKHSSPSGDRNNYHPQLKKEISRSIKKLQRHCTTGGRFISGSPQPKNMELRNWFVDKNLKGFLNHEARSHMPSDFARYLFVSSFGKVFGYSPKIIDFPKHGGILPAHKNISKARDRRSGDFADRFRVQLPDRPATTIVSHIRKDGHYYIHYDPSQCRSLTVREAARLQTFPDNYFFEGNRTEQYEQVGNAVPPYLAHQIAEVVAATLTKVIKNRR